MMASQSQDSSLEFVISGIDVVITNLEMPHFSIRTMIGRWARLRGALHFHSLVSLVLHRFLHCLACYGALISQTSDLFCTSPH